MKHGEGMSKEDHLGRREYTHHVQKSLPKRVGMIIVELPSLMIAFPL